MLAMTFGYLDVDQLLADITERDFQRWLTYYQVEPWGEQRADLRSAIIACTIANCSGSKKRWKPKDFMPFAEQSTQQQASVLQALTKMMGGEIENK